MAIDTSALFNQRIIQSIGFIGYGEVGKTFASALKPQTSQGVAWVGVWDVLFDEMRDLPDAEMERAEAVAKRERQHARDRGIAAAGSAKQLCETATLIISCVTASNTLAVAEEVAKHIQRGSYFLDFNSASPATKQACAKAIEATGGHYIDAKILLSTAPISITTPIQLLGEHAEKLAAALAPLGFNANKHANKKIRIGGASGFWGDSSMGAPQLVDSGEIDYLVFDYLAELTMSLLAGAKLKNPALGYATDFVTSAMAQVLPKVVSQNIRVVTNAGGVNPEACALALAALAASMNIPLRIAVVTGDDVLPLMDTLRAQDVRHMTTGEAIPAQLVSANAYLGAAPIARALDEGAQVVITGRCVDSAVTLGVLMHEFKWTATDFDLLASGSLAGHIIECGCQATGGLHTDWESVPDWANIGYPIVVCEADGAFTVTKPKGTGGLINRATVGEQLLYEIGDPAAYLLPDVVCDFTQVNITQTSAENGGTVRVTNAKGRAPSPFYKVTATYAAGFRCNAELVITGFDAAAKAQRTGEAIVERTSQMLRSRGMTAYNETHIDVLGAEYSYGAHATNSPPRQAVLRVAVTHNNKAALDIFAKEISAAGTSWSPGTTGLGGGRPTPAMSIRQFPLLIPKTMLTATVVMDGQRWAIEQEPSYSNEIRNPAPANHSTPLNAVDSGVPSNGECITVPLIQLAYGRSGDKGDISNIGIMARHPKYLPMLREQLTAEAVAAYLAHLVQGTVTRYELPGIDAFNFVCEAALGGGGMASLRSDPLGKGMAQILLSMPINTPA
jgi:Acyclic terpene utilisation family protein AtuA/NAD binding domain of 6-phosphogluconate dehydrogenase